MAKKNYWLMKSEPEVFSFDDLLKAPSKKTSWEGVRNYQARNFMRDEFRVGDGVLFYHSNCPETGIAGIAEVAKASYPDASALDPKSEYYDEKAAQKGDSPWVLVDVKAVARLDGIVTRDQLRAEKKLAKMMVLKKGSRLSVQPVTAEEFELVCKLGRAKKI